MVEEAEKSIEFTLPSLEEFTILPLDEQVRIFIGLPISLQKIMIGGTNPIFVASAQAEMVQVVSKVKPEEFQPAKNILVKAGFLKEVEGNRLEVPASMKTFINVDLKAVWEQQKLKTQQGNS